MQNKNPNKNEALNVLRGLFAGMFLSQIVIASLISIILVSFSEAQSSSLLFAQILMLFSFLQLPLGISLPLVISQISPNPKNSKVTALSAVILTAVILSSPAWFAALPFITGSPSLYLIIIIAVVTFCYSAGFIMCNRYAELALMPAPSEQTKEENTANL